jgi:hypothetical protein
MSEDIKNTQQICIKPEAGRRGTGGNACHQSISEISPVLGGSPLDSLYCRGIAGGQISRFDADP